MTSYSLDEPNIDRSCNGPISGPSAWIICFGRFLADFGSFDHTLLFPMVQVYQVIIDVEQPWIIIGPSGNLATWNSASVPAPVQGKIIDPIGYFDRRERPIGLFKHFFDSLVKFLFFLQILRRLFELRYRPGRVQFLPDAHGVPPGKRLHGKRSRPCTVRPFQTYRSRKDMEK